MRGPINRNWKLFYKLYRSNFDKISVIYLLVQVPLANVKWSYRPNTDERERTLF
jgi:hypothetical protein